jgi:flavin reductase (DIM6/NTAB) family NADH-FMN oxidoreductase RutF
LTERRGGLVTWKSVDASQMRNCMGRFLTGVGVLTTADGGELHGMTVNSIASVSLDPPLLLVCLMEDARTTQVVNATRRFNLSILGSENEAICRRFAERGADHYRDVQYELDPDGVPILAGAVVQLRCRLEGAHRHGDHLVLVGNVEFARLPKPDPRPLAYFCGRFYEIQPRTEEASELDSAPQIFPPTESVEWAWRAPALSW